MKRSKIYCGDKSLLPTGYDSFGSRYQCLRKGIGTGLYVIPAKEKGNATSNNNFSVSKSSLIQIGNILHLNGLDGLNNKEMINKIINRLKVVSAFQARL